MEEGSSILLFRFVALSSRSHQTYTRKWSNSCKIPVFSIDYRKAP